MKNVKIKFFLTFIICIAYFILYNINEYYKEKFINTELNTSVKELQTNYNIISFHYKNVADAFFESFATNKMIIESLKKLANTQNNSEKNILREKLYSMMLERYNSSLQLGVSALLFSDPNNNTLLRMHDKTKYGDQLEQKRFGINYVNNTHKAITGFEVGDFLHAFRYIYPLFDANNSYLGCVDIGFSPSFLQNTFDQVHELHTHFILHKSVIPTFAKQNIFTQPNYQQSVEHEDFLLSIRQNVKHTQKLIVKETMHNYKELIKQKMQDSKAFCVYGFQNDTAVISSFIPINSIEKKPYALAYLVSHNPNDQILRIISQHRYINYAVFFILLLLWAYFYKEISYKYILEEKVAQKTKELQNINENLETKVKEEVAKNLQHEIKIYEQSKLAALGDMIGNIVHQWRQPLSAIVSIMSATRLQNDMGTLKSDMLNDNMNKVTIKAKYLSETIETFRNYLREEKIKQKVLLQERIDIALTITSTVLDDHYIKLINNVNYDKPIYVNIVVGELTQVIINIINNAKDILLEKNLDEPWVSIELEEKNNFVYIYIEDNAGGIPKQNLSHIFEQYYTTKDKDTGTGIGLYMSKKIMQDSFQGDLTVQNTHNGAKFTISLPID